ncbi:MAG: EF-hand domain-containing protein [Gammaproteobacteria bacterium]|nr:EF-hand domain-containing protein [Gammaproteobacteria bacterium]MCB1923040.1 EF-hand domain-containing protein [Gammaproteobacteria bacterium]
MKIKHMIVVAAGALLATSVAFAAPAKFDKADANGDGSVDATEFAASGVKKKFEKLDKDGDGKLSKKEYSVVFDEDCE